MWNQPLRRRFSRNSSLKFLTSNTSKPSVPFSVDLWLESEVDLVERIPYEDTRCQTSARPLSLAPSSLNVENGTYPDCVEIVSRACHATFIFPENELHPVPSGFHSFNETLGILTVLKHQADMISLAVEQNQIKTLEAEEGQPAQHMLPRILTVQVEKSRKRVREDEKARFY
ncbi:hypothetical protein Moror_16229 [Moniliophthora roreri MCA 2997]|uniref:Uncharacterized protein n=1 Tax=Moniliophthora roreri (strain MCA 2997) TaxID=1381753 RepID=V2X9A4_MONRO|nr:hypothetical protein Moror_16229 [Moniliophthora roreri MCA 2997]